MKTRLLFPLLMTFLFAKAQTVSTAVGSTSGDVIGNASVSRFYGPYGIASDGGDVTVTDSRNNKIKVIYSDNSTALRAGSTTAGFVNGTGVAARFNSPTGIARTRFNNFVICDTGNNAIRGLTSAGVVTTVSGGTLGFLDGHQTVAQFNQPYGIAVDTRNDDIYVADTFNHKIRKVSAFTVSTFAGSTQGYTDGTGSAAQFDTPMGLVVDTNGNVFVLDKARIRKITPAGIVTTFAGGSVVGYQDGNGTNARFGSASSGITIDANNNLYVADINNYRIRKITPAGDVTTYAGTGTVGSLDGDASIATFSTAPGLVIKLGTTILYVADYGNERIRKVVAPALPVLSSVTLSGINSTGATFNYTITPNNTTTTSKIKYGYSSTLLNNEIIGFSASGSSAVNGNVVLTGITPSTLVYYQVQITNPAGTVSSSTGSFTTLSGPPQLLAQYNFDNAYENINGSFPFSSTGTSFVNDRNGDSQKALRITNVNSSIATLPFLPTSSSSRTISLWYKTDTFTSGTPNIFVYGSNASNQYFGHYVNSVGNSFLWSYVTDFNFGGSYVQNTWRHAVFTYDGTSVKLYINGTYIGQQNYTLNTGNSIGFKLGGAGLVIEVDDLKIYNYALSQTDITSLYTNNTLSSSEFAKNNLKIALYPNPVNDVLNIESETEIKSVEIFNLLGQKVKTSSSKQVNVFDLATGTYMVRIQDKNNGVATKKIVKQ
ncbi:MAG TPA: hypothetical protein DCS17_04285 [Flavobacterium sp.]|nr:hypothetical protein [Flavobacterium sp.]